MASSFTRITPILFIIGIFIMHYLTFVNAAADGNGKMFILRKQRRSPPPPPFSGPNIKWKSPPPRPPPPPAKAKAPGPR